MTLESLDFESEHVFESHEHLQSTADIMPALTSFKKDQIGRNLGQIGPKQPILKVKTRDLNSSTFLKVITTVSAYIKLLEPTPVTKCVNWTKFGPNLGQIWAKFGPNRPNWIGVPILIVDTCTYGINLT